MLRKRFFQCLAATVLVACIFAQPAAVIAQGANTVAGSFICMVDSSEDAFAIGQRAVEATGGTLGHVYTHALNGFSIQVPPGIVVANLRAQRGVIHAEPDLVMHTCADTIPTGIDRIDAEKGFYDGIDCSGIGIAIIDTGIDVDHPDLNVVGGRRFYTTGLRQRQDNNYDDDNGHGTHCAGIAAARYNGSGVVGVAPGASLYAVKVLNANGSGYMSDIIAGVDWVTANAANIAVANMSLTGAGTSSTLKTAIQKSVAKGVTYTVAAGNDNADVDGYIPASYGDLPGVYTISAFVDTDGGPGGYGPSTTYGADDKFASFSNYSTKNKIAYVMPGVNINSTFKGGGYTTMSGTSMAAPHAAGVLALYGTAIAIAQNDSCYGLINGGDKDSWAEPVGYAVDPGTCDDGGNPPPDDTTLSVAELAGSAELKGKSGQWEVFVTAWIDDAADNPVPGVIVSGTWSGAKTGTVSGTTDSNGSVTFATGNMKSGTSVTFTITNAVKSGYTYDPESSATTVTVSK